MLINDIEMKKSQILKNKVEHIDIKRFDATSIIKAMSKMSFSARETARAAELFDTMLKDKECAIILTIAGSTSGAGCMKIYSDMVKYNMIDVVVATGATIVDMDFFEALGFRHYQGTPLADNHKLRKLYIDRIYDTYIDEEQLQVCDNTVKKIADKLKPRPYSSREFIIEMGRYLKKHAKKQNSLVEAALDKGVPIFCPAFSDSSAGFGLVKHQFKKKGPMVTIDSVKDFLELTKIKISVPTTGLFMIGGGVPKNFAQDSVVCAEVLGFDAPMHKYAVQITVADVRDGACSSSTLKEAHSWGKVGQNLEQMVFGEATTVLPLIISYAYHRGSWKKRKQKNFNKLLNGGKT